MNRLSLAIAASLLTLVALAPRRAAAAPAPRERPANVRTFRLDRPGVPRETLAQNDQMYMQQETPGAGSADTGDQSPPDDQSVDTETGENADPQAQPSDGGSNADNADGGDQSGDSSDAQPDDSSGDSAQQGDSGY